MDAQAKQPWAQVAVGEIQAGYMKRIAQGDKDSIFEQVAWGTEGSSFTGNICYLA